MELSAGKVMATVFWDNKDVLLVEYQLEGTTNSGIVQFSQNFVRFIESKSVVVSRQCSFSFHSANKRQTIQMGGFQSPTVLSGFGALEETTKWS